MNLKTFKSNKSKWPKLPYKGLSYYEQEDLPIFAGRESDRMALAREIAEPDCRLVILHGLTGCGKSSFLRAEVIPFLESHSFDFFKKNMKPLFIRSTGNPLIKLAESLFDYLSITIIKIKAPDNKEPIGFRLSQSLGDYKNRSRKEFSKDVSKDYNILLTTLEKLSRILPETFVMVIDQAEEVITLNQGNEALGAKFEFFKFIADFSKTTIDMKIIITIRTEFYGRFDNEIDKRHALVKVHKFYLPELHIENLIKAIERPTSDKDYIENGVNYGSPRKHYKFIYEDGVAEKISQDLIKAVPAGGLLTALQIVCGRLYKKKINQPHHNGNIKVITLHDYKESGSFEDQVEKYLIEVLEEFCQRDIKKRLTTQDEIKQEIICWETVLSELVKNQVDGSVTTEIKTEEDLKKVAMEQGCKLDFTDIMNFLSEERQRIVHKSKILEVATGNTIDVYSLGHDAIGLALRNWETKHKATEAFKQERPALELVNDLKKNPMLIEDPRWLNKFIEATGIAGVGTVFGERLEHFIEEKSFIAERAIDIIEKKLENSKLKYCLLIDSGTTLYPLFQEISKRIRNEEKKDLWKKRSFIITNNLPGAQYLMKACKKDPKDRFSDIAVKCFILPGKPLAIYAAVTGEETEKWLSIVEYFLKREWNCRRYEFKILGFITGNYFVRHKDKQGRTIGYYPVARGEGHVEVKQKMIEKSDEVFLLSPLMKFSFAGVDLLNYENVFTVDREDSKAKTKPSKVKYVEIPISKEKSFFITTKRKNGNAFYDFYKSFYKELKERYDERIDIVDFDLDHYIKNIQNELKTKPEKRKTKEEIELELEIPHKNLREKYKKDPQLIWNKDWVDKKEKELGFSSG